MVKDDNHRTRGLYFNNVELPIDTHSEGFKLITRIQDEVHRFSVEYHRKKHTKSALENSLTQIKGIGEKTEKTLQKLGIATVGDLLSYYPRNYETYELPTPIGELKEGKISFSTKI